MLILWEKCVIGITGACFGMSVVLLVLSGSHESYSALLP